MCRNDSWLFTRLLVPVAALLETMAALLQTWWTSLCPEVGFDEWREDERGFRWRREEAEKQRGFKKREKEMESKRDFTCRTNSRRVQVLYRSRFLLYKLVVGWTPLAPACKSWRAPISVCACAQLRRALWLWSTCLRLILLCNVCSSPASGTTGSEQQVFCSCLFDPGIYRAPAKAAPLLGTSRHCVFLSSFSFTISCLLRLSRKRSSSLPSSFPPSLPPCCSCLKRYHFSDSFLFHSICQDKKSKGIKWNRGP